MSQKRLQHLCQMHRPESATTPNTTDIIRIETFTRRLIEQDVNKELEHINDLAKEWHLWFACTYTMNDIDHCYGTSFTNEAIDFSQNVLGTALAEIRRQLFSRQCLVCSPAMPYSRKPLIGAKHCRRCVSIRSMCSAIPNETKREQFLLQSSARIAKRMLTLYKRMKLLERPQRNTEAWTVCCILSTPLQRC